MPKTLIICEKPSVARDLVAALPGHFAESNDLYESDTHVIGFAVGHLVEQVDPDAYDARFKRWRFEDLPILPDEFRYEPRDAKAGKQLRSLHAAMRRKDVDELVNACDAGREGELIFKLILQTANVQKPVRRAWFSSMTKTRDPRRVRAPARRLRAPTARGRGAGSLRVRLADRHERDARRDHSHRHAALAGLARPGADADPRADRAARPRDLGVRPRGLLAGAGPVRHRRQASATPACGSRARRTASRAPRRPSASPRWRAAPTRVVESVERKPLVEQPPLLYDLTTLQREANQRFGFTAKRTLRRGPGLLRAPQGPDLPADELALHLVRPRAVAAR